MRVSARLTTYLLIPLMGVGLPAHARSKGQQKSVIDQLRFVPGDEKGNEVKALETEILVSKSEKLAMAQLKRLAKKYKDNDAMESDLLFRMAELYMRRARSERFFELNRDSQMVLSFMPKVVGDTTEKGKIQEAIKIYNKIQHKYPQFDSMDMVIFNDGFAEQQLGHTVEAEALYTKLIFNYPGSPLVPDSELAIGEINYNRKDFQEAFNHFEAIRKFPNAHVYPYGLYKAAWSQYNMRHNEQALELLEEVVAYGKRIHDLKLDSKLDLRKEALNDMTLFFEDTMPPSKAISFFAKQSGELPVEPTLLKLGRLYTHHSRYDDAIVVYSGFVRRFDDSPYLRIVDNEMIRAYEDKRDRESAVAELEKMKSLCDETRTAKYNQSIANDPNQIVTNDDKTCDELLYDTSHYLAAKWHSMWMKNKTYPIFAKGAQKAYEIELSLNHADKTEVNSTRFEYAELLFQLAKYRQASAQYALVSQSTQDPKLRHNSDHAALVALGKAVGDKWSDADEAQFKKLADIYRLHSPNGPYRLDIDFQQAFIAYEKNHYDEAAPMFQKIGWKYRNTEKGRKAQDLYLDILNIKKDYAQLRQRSKELLSFKGNDQARTLSLGKIYREAYFSQIQSLEEKGQLDKAIQEYKTFAAANAGSDLAPKAYWNAIQLQYKNQDLKGATDSSYEYYKKFPTAPNTKDALLQAAQGYESMAEPSAAAHALCDLAKVDSKNAEKWLSVAADFYALGHDSGHARPLYSQLSKSKNKEISHASLEKWLALEKATNDSAGLKQVRQMILMKNVQPEASLALLEHVQSLYADGNKSDAFEQAKKIISMDGASRTAKAKARFIQARILEDEFRSQSVKSRLDRIAMVLAIKTEKLDKAQRAYEATIKYGDPSVSISALQQLSGCYGDYAKAVRSIQLPPNTSQADVAAFRKEIDTLAIPMEEKSVDTLVEALKLAKRAQLRDGSVAQIQMQINRLNMVSSSGAQQVLKAPPMMVPTFSSPEAGI